MSIFSRLFRNREDRAVFKMITDVGNGFYSFDGKLYRSDIVRACIKPKTKAIGKAVARHIRESVIEAADGTKTKKTEVNPVVSMKFLLEEPNNLMTGQMLQEKVANQLQLNGNAFILILRDSNGVPNGLYPIPAVSAECRYSSTGDLSLKFIYCNGKWSEFPYSDVIHIRDDFYSNDVFGDSPVEGLSEMMDLVKTTDQGIKYAIKNSAIVRWLLKFTSSMRPEDLKLRANEFAENYLDIERGGSMGVAAVDSKADAIQVKSDNYVPESAQNSQVIRRIYAFFNTNDKIVRSEYNEDEWIAYYEAAIEPVIMQLSGEYTRKIFTRKERSFGNKIIFWSGSLTYASMKTKLSLIRFLDRGTMTPNEVRAEFGYPPVEGGDKPLIRKDTGFLVEEGEGTEE